MIEFAYIAFQALCGLITAFVLNMLLTPRWHKAVTYAVIVSCCITMTCILIWTNFSYIRLFYIPSLLAYILLLFKDEVRNKILVFVLIVLSSMLSELFVHNIVKMFGIKSEIIYSYVGYSLSALLTICLYVYVVRVFSAIMIEKIGKGLYLFLLLPASQMFIIGILVFYVQCFGYMDIASKTWNIDATLTTGVLMTVAVFLCVGADVLFVNGFIQNSRLKKQLVRVQALEYENELNMQYYSDLQDNSRKIREIRHDLNNILQSIYLLIYNENTGSEDYKNLYEDLKKKVGSITIRSFCSNELINAILSSKLNSCKDKGVELKITAAVPQELSIADIDICSCVTNLLDNAIEAQVRLPSDTEKLVKVNIAFDGDYLTVRTVNSSPAYAKKLSAETKTTKHDKDEHGFGNKILCEIAERYDGTYILQRHGESCVAMLVLKATQKAPQQPDCLSLEENLTPEIPDADKHTD